MSNNTDLVPINELERNICELYAEGNSIDFIAVDLGLEKRAVISTIKKPHCNKYIKELITELNAASKEGRIRILNRIIEDKIKKVEEDLGGDFASATNKDLPDLIIAMDNMLKEKEKKELGTQENTTIQILNQIYSD